MKIAETQEQKATTYSLWGDPVIIIVQFIEILLYYQYVYSNYKQLSIFPSFSERWNLVLKLDLELGRLRHVLR